jgi:hypothetical protein
MGLLGGEILTAVAGKEAETDTVEIDTRRARKAKRRVN